MDMIVVGDDSHFDKVLKAMNRRFKNQEDFEFRMDIYAIETAQELNGLYDRVGETLLFRFGQAMLVKDLEIFLDPEKEGLCHTH